MKQKPKRKKQHFLPRSKHPIGFAARDIKAGELIEYSPFRNTNDIRINKAPSSSEIEEAIKILQAHIRLKHACGSTCITTALCNRLKEAN